MYNQILFFTLILFIDLFIGFINLYVDLRYYFDTNNEGLTVYKQVLLFTLIFFIDLFIDFIDLRFYFNTNKRV